MLVSNIKYACKASQLLHTIFVLNSDPDGKERKIYYKADKKGYQVSYDSKKNFRETFFIELKIIFFPVLRAI